MSRLDQQHWPREFSRSLSFPQTHLYRNVEVSALRYPDKPFLVYYDTKITFAQFKRDVDAMAGYLQTRVGVRKGDRVLLVMQNSPQFAVAYYAVLRADAIVVPVNPMCRTEELRHYLKDTGADTAFIAQDLYASLRPLLQEGLAHVVVASYCDYLRQPTDLPLPDFVAEPRRQFDDAGVTGWAEAMAYQCQPEPLQGQMHDVCVMPYTSGTTGRPMGCMHTHASTMHPMVATALWHHTHQDTVYLASLPFFHVTGMQSGMNCPLYLGATSVVFSRWDRDIISTCIERYQISRLPMITAMVVEFMSNPKLGQYDLSSVRRISGGGAAMPEAVSLQLKQNFGLDYIEGYGMTETMAPTHSNPLHRPKPQCLGIPIFDTIARIIDPDTQREVQLGQVGEIIVNGPQLMQGYWRNAAATEAAFMEFEGKRFLRTGDLGRQDEDGYYFMVDRLKRMINASGFKVWPAEVELLMYGHQAISECCVIGVPDEKRGETVKAFVILRAGFEDTLSEEQLIAWCKENMAAYKAPRHVQFVQTLPRTASGKIRWKTLMD
ncbi:long-chain-fatty-acid--CoA ligase [Allopusillimonas ginsengisoli]|uniref:long-chain-fatty-acid--CoA ligase n=1 Tax=Allopusillimonas ginsengisoli TaxID=453575 RepID=UPI0039C246AF